MLGLKFNILYLLLDLNSISSNLNCTFLMKLKPLAIFIGLSLLCCFATNATWAAAEPEAINGVIDLRNHDLSEPVVLDGQWDFYWKQLLDPNAAVTNKGIPINFPSLWIRKEINGVNLPGFGYATYKLTVLLPKTSVPLRLSMPDVYSAYNLFINGKLVAQNGTVTTSAAGFKAYWQYKAFDLPANTDTLHITLQISNFMHSKGGIKKSLILGNKDVVELQRQRDEAIDLILTGCLFMGGLFFLGLYIFGNRDKAVLLFSLYCIVYSYRI
jgi:hypothetical protein